MLENYPNIKKIFSEKLFIGILLVISVILNLFLALEVKRLKSILSLIQGEKKEYQLILGKTVPTLTVQNAAGETKVIKFSESKIPTLIYVFSPDCIWCERNTQNINYLYQQNQSKFNFVGVSVQKSSSSANTIENNIRFPIYYNPSDSDRIDYNFSATPSTYIISAEGKIIKFWSGAYGNETLKDIENYFEMKLPGLSE